MSTSIRFVPRAENRSCTFNFVTPETPGHTVFEAIYEEPHERSISLGLFVTREAAERVCVAADAANRHFGSEHFRVEERVLQGA